MKKYMDPSHQLKGISLLEAVISTLILVAGVLAFAQSHSNQIASGLDNLERQQAALIASDINNMIAAHVNSLGTAVSAQTVKNEINALKKDIQTKASTIATSRGYSCKNNTPTITGKTTSTTTTTSTALLPWTTGPAFCIVIEIPAGQVLNSNVNGTWVKTSIYWQPLKRADNTTDSISISTLMLPM